MVTIEGEAQCGTDYLPDQYQFSLISLKVHHYFIWGDSMPSENTDFQASL